MSAPLRTTLIAAALLLAAVGAYALGLLLRPAPELAGTRIEQPPELGDVTLVNEARGETSLAEIADEGVTLVFFGYTRCPDVCPTTMARLAQAYRDLGEPAELRVVMATVDPEHDDPATLERYVDGFHPDFVGLSGSSSQVAAAAKRFFVGFHAAGPQVAHTDAVAVLDDEARMRLVYTAGSLRGLVEDLPRLLARGPA